MSLKTFFSNEWANFINWLGDAEVSVVANAKPVIDLGVQLAKTDLLADGNAVFTSAVDALKSSHSIIASIGVVYNTLKPLVIEQGIEFIESELAAIAAIFTNKVNAQENIRKNIAVTDSAPVEPAITVTGA